MSFIRIIFFTFLISLPIFSIGCKEKKTKPKTVSIVTKDTIKQPKIYQLRKYGHVKKLYHRLAIPITELCIKHKAPPGAILSILSLESGWGKGYIGQITGNFLSLNAVGKDAELPALYLPSLNNKSNRILFDENEISKIDSSKVTWKLRPASLKKDYRPVPYAGTINNLAFFNSHPQKLTEANIKNVEDFVKRFISSTSKIKAYRDARKFLNTEIEKYGIEILFDLELNKTFINTIGGKPNSYNFRETWPKKVISIMNGVGAVPLSKNLYEKTLFESAWKL
jgi:hypothetical protein